MEYDTRNWQYRQLITVYHGQNFGHYLEQEVVIKGREGTKRIGLGQWRGLGVPDDVLRSSSGLIIATWEEHLVSRYGIQNELPSLWSTKGGAP